MSASLNSLVLAYVDRAYLSVELDSSDGLALLQQHGGILEQQGLHLRDVVLLGQLHCLVPLAQ